MCIDAPESTTNSRSSGLRFHGAAQSSTNSHKVRRMLFYFLFYFRMLLASLHAASRAHRSCPSVSSWDRSSNFGALVLRWWSSPEQIIPSDGFWSRMSAWRTTALLNRTHRIGYRLFELFRKIDEDFGGSISGKYATQLSCIWWVSILIKSPCSVVMLILLQHGYCTFVIILFKPFCRLFINLTMCEWALFTKPTTTLGLVVQAFWRVPSFTKWVIASSSKVILARPSRHSTAGTSASGTSGSRWFSLTLLHERIRRRIWWCNFSTLIRIVAETVIVSFHTLPVGFPLPTISKNSLYTLYCSLIIDHCVLLKFSISAPKILISNFLLDTSFHHSFHLW